MAWHGDSTSWQHREVSERTADTVGQGAACKGEGVVLKDRKVASRKTRRNGPPGSVPLVCVGSGRGQARHTRRGPLCLQHSKVRG